MRRAAAWRGGECLSETMAVGDWDSLLSWRCARGHVFEASPRQVLLGGHWCPDCFPNPYAQLPKDQQRPWAWDREAKRNPFFAQLWVPLHDANEDNVYGPEVFDGWEK